MYAAIAEPLAIYAANSGTGSDTYAKINDGLGASALGSNGIDGVPNSSSGLFRPISSLANSSSTVGLDRAAAESMERLNSSPIPPTPPSVVSLRQLSAGSNRLHGKIIHFFGCNLCSFLFLVFMASLDAEYCKSNVWRGISKTWKTSS
jgi:hypothetical protein